jgi:hypothetical protein
MLETGNEMVNTVHVSSTRIHTLRFLPGVADPIASIRQVSTPSPRSSATDCWDLRLLGGSLPDGLRFDIGSRRLHRTARQARYVSLYGADQGFIVRITKPAARGPISRFFVLHLRLRAVGLLRYLQPSVVL